jgi:hypothetical protein
MPVEYITARFFNDNNGIKERHLYLSKMAAQGWRVVSESIDPSHMRGGQACCLASICLPLGFLAGRTTGTINMTLTREFAGYLRR